MKVKTVMLGFGLLCLIAAIVFSGVVWFISERLPSEHDIRDIHLQIPMRVYTADGKLIAEFGEKRRIPKAYQDIPITLVHAFIAAEDDRFFRHHGVDVAGLLRAAWQLIKTGRKDQGGSTITMQTARNVFLGRQKTYLRKLSEILLALRMERILSKEQIMELYLNKIYLGNRAYGVGAAAQVYYGKKLDELNLEEVAMIAGLPKAPSRYNPIVNPERARIRRNYVLSRMLELDFISREDYLRATGAADNAYQHGRVSEVEAPHLAEMVRSDMVKRFGEKAYTQGYRVYTTLRSNLQQAANMAVRNNLLKYDTRHGYRGPERSLGNGTDLSTKPSPDVLEEWVDSIRRFPEIGHLLPAVVAEIKDKSVVVLTRNGREVLIPWEGLNWARPYISESAIGPAPRQAADILHIGDIIRITPSTSGKGFWRLTQIPQAEASLVALDPQNGAIVAMNGGFDYLLNKFNHVTQARRQPGSNFKPFLYSAALENGYTAASLINDAPVVFDDPSLETIWRPENYSGKFFGPTRLREALYKSRNLVSIRLLRAVGIEKVIQYVKRFGFNEADLPHNLSLALGSASISPLQIARGYAIFANGGFFIEPYYIDRIADRNNEILFQAEPVIVCKACIDKHDELRPNRQEEVLIPPERLAKRVIEERNAYIMTTILQDVIKKGTGRRARVLGRKDIAGKTGTTNDQKDAWFSGFQPQLEATTWIGFDRVRSLGPRETGSRAALPIWIDFMRIALKDIPEVTVSRPAGLVTVRIDPVTGKRVHANVRPSILEIFRRENIPQYLQKKEASRPTDFSPEQQLF
ncbi:MAG: penicillin-binding protein 1A [Gammaproteobacteria bacterium]|nr:MAG: penicillin-binding protein 1A [Gammaproteobacteria bacterium]